MNFGGHCQEAMTAYHAWLGGDLSITLVVDSPAAGQWTGSETAVYHSTLATQEFTLMGSDSDLDGSPTSLVAQTSSKDEIRRLFELASEGGIVHCDLGEAPWGGYYAQVTDRFGTTWHMTCD